MTKKEMQEKVQANFFNDNITYTVDELGKISRYFTCYFGELYIEVEDDKHSSKAGSKIINYIDVDEVSVVKDSKTGEVKKLDESIDMSTINLLVNVDESGRIVCVSTATGGLFTWANKDFVMFASSLVGKKINMDGYK